MEASLFTSFLPDQHLLCEWLLHYGSFALFVLLALGVFALPVPEEGLMVLAGVLMSKGHLYITWTLMAAYGGSMCGITMSYIFGSTIGAFFITKYGGWLGFTESRLQSAHQWFERYGKWSLFFGYFIPGVRHFTGIAAGVTKLTYSHFALFAYLGAFFWASLFMSLGYFFNTFWLEVLALIESGIEEIVIFVILVAVLFVLFKLKKNQR